MWISIIPSHLPSKTEQVDFIEEKLALQEPILPVRTVGVMGEAHEKICPYSHGMRNNVPVDLEVKGG